MSIFTPINLQALSKETGVSWNKRFKKHHGTISKVGIKGRGVEIYLIDIELKITTLI